MITFLETRRNPCQSSRRSSESTPPGKCFVLIVFPVAFGPFVLHVLEDDLREHRDVAQHRRDRLFREPLGVFDRRLHQQDRRGAW
jgi:hypothetical protein